MKTQIDFKPHRLCGQKQLYQYRNGYKQFPEAICMDCISEQNRRKEYRRGYSAGYRAGSKHRRTDR